jgi:putative membrane protein
MKFTLTIAASTAALALGAGAQTRSTAPAPQNQPIVTAEASAVPAGDKKNAEDIEFLTNARRTGLAEIEIGALAAERGHDARVRDYGAKLVADHTQQVEEIEALLKPLNVNIPEEPSAEAQLHHAALARLAGEDFDSKFVETMIASHAEAIEKYGAQTHANPDRALADFASKSLVTLREHLAIAESLR